jgi:hypothetical protein
MSRVMLEHRLALYIFISIYKSAARFVPIPVIWSRFDPRTIDDRDLHPYINVPGPGSYEGMLGDQQGRSLHYIVEILGSP